MAKKVEASSTSTKKSPMVYLRGEGIEKKTDVWYRIDVESLRLHSIIDTNKPKTECPTCYAMTMRPNPEPMQLSPFARMGDSKWGGSWTIGDEDIYYVGGIVKSNPHRGDKNNEPMDPYYCTNLVSRNLFKLNAKNPSSDWKITSSSRKFARSMPFVALIDRKLYVLGGYNLDNEGRESENFWGEIFDLDSKKWKVLELDIKSIIGDHIDSNSLVVVVEKEGEHPRIVLLPYTNTGQLFSYSVSTGEFFIEDHPSLDLCKATCRDDCRPKGLEGCENIDILDRIRREVRPVVNNSTFYWFTYDLYLYGYDLVEKRWFQSKCLKRELWTITPRSWWDFSESRSLPSILVALCNGKFLLVVPRGSGESAVAILDVVKEKDSLNVSVESLHTLVVDDDSFWPDDGMVMQV